MLSCLYYPIFEIGVNSYIQYQYHFNEPWLFPLYPFNKYTLKERFLYCFNFLFLSWSIGYILDNNTFATQSFLINIRNFIGVTLFESGLIYYGHRYAHYNKFLYTTMHYIHHTYKEVKPFQANSAFPLEIITYVGLALVFPVYIFPLSKSFYMLYVLMIMGTGVLDHTGEEFNFLGYNSRDHQGHHLYGNKNFGFPLTIYDKLHNTYQEFQIS